MRGKGGIWWESKCKKCNHPAMPVNGNYYWCPECGWRSYTNGNHRNLVF